MSAFRNWWRAMPTVVALACAVPSTAAPALTTIQDVLYKADGSRFNGTVVFTWNNFQSGDDVPIPTQGLTVAITNGMLKVRLVPTTNASAGASYSVKYMSQGIYQFTETWAVPVSDTPLRVRDVRIANGTIVGPPPVITEIAISDVTNLSEELAVRPMKGASFGPARTAVINASGQIDAAAGNAGDCMHVDGSSGPCGSSGPSDVAFADGETPTGLVNGVNTVFTLASIPSPTGSLMFYRNGILMKQLTDYAVSGNTVTFYTASVPQPGDLLTASYRYTSTVQSPLTLQFADGETPVGTVDGTNAAFTLAAAPSPATSLQIFRNGVLMKQGADYQVSGAGVTFVAASTPQIGDVLTAFYRY